MKIQTNQPEAIVKRMFWLAYQACGRAAGMGVWQARSDATEEAVWQNVRLAADYGPGADRIMRSNEPGEAYGDYVFGRMMKLGVKWTEHEVELRDTEPRADYQSWCRVYPTYDKLAIAALESLTAVPAGTAS